MEQAHASSFDVLLGLRQRNSLLGQSLDLCKGTSHEINAMNARMPAGDWMRWMLCCTSLRSRCASSSLVANNLQTVDQSVVQRESRS